MTIRFIALLVQRTCIPDLSRLRKLLPELPLPLVELFDALVTGVDVAHRGRLGSASRSSGQASYAGAGASSSKLSAKHHCRNGAACIEGMEGEKKGGKKKTKQIKRDRNVSSVKKPKVNHWQKQVAVQKETTSPGQETRLGCREGLTRYVLGIRRDWIGLLSGRGGSGEEEFPDG